VFVVLFTRFSTVCGFVNMLTSICGLLLITGKIEMRVIDT